jgi:hypothetical protein
MCWLIAMSMKRASPDVRLAAGRGMTPSAL